MICWSLGGNVSHAHATVAVKECHWGALVETEMIARTP